MTNLIYLGIAVIISLIGCLVLWARNRKPSSMDASIKKFASDLQALAPTPTSAPRGRASRREKRPASGSRRARER